MRIFTLLTLLCFCGISQAQDIATFENYNLQPGAHINDSGSTGYFESGPVILPNAYDETYDFWSGWAISAANDSSTPGFSNQYSAIPGHGANGSATYAVAFASDGVILRLDAEHTGGIVSGLYVTNSAYAYYSMLDGDAFAKKFGGETGDDPDFFLLTIKKYHNGSLSEDSVDFYLADYRFTDNSQDYIVDDWQFIDLSGLGEADSLLFSLSSSDVGIFGMNTPAYFCADNIEVSNITAARADYQPAIAFSVFPNPATDAFSIDLGALKTGTMFLYNASGSMIYSRELQTNINIIPVSNLEPGLYFVGIHTGKFQTSRKLVIYR